MVELIWVMFGLIGIIVYQQVAHKQTVDKLLDRLMARDLPELNAITDGVEVNEPESLSDRKEYEIECKRDGIIPEPEVK